MQELWAKLKERLGLSRERGDLRWLRLADAQQSEFFNWFSFVEEETVKNKESHTVVRFRPSGEKFHRLVRLDAVLDRKDRITRVQLSLDQSFVDDRKDGLFARDLAKSFLRAAVPKPDAGAVGGLANEIERRHRFPVISLQPSPQPPLPTVPTPGFQAFIGQQQLFEADYSMSRLKIERTTADNGPAVQIMIQFTEC